MSKKTALNILSRSQSSFLVHSSEERVKPVKILRLARLLVVQF